MTSNPFRQRPANVITEATLKRLPMPTLLITGEADLYSPPALIRMVAAQIPNSEVVIVREAGHSSYWEQPEEFNRAVSTPFQVTPGTTGRTGSEIEVSRRKTYRFCELPHAVSSKWQPSFEPTGRISLAMPA